MVEGQPVMALEMALVIVTPAKVARTDRLGGQGKDAKYSRSETLRG